MFEDIRKKFPVYEKNPDLIFLDTAASALKPYDMIDAITNCYSYEYANVHRGLYSLSSKLTKKFEDARVKVSNFISSKSYENIIFTKSATEGINLVVEKFSEKYLSEGDEVKCSGTFSSSKEDYFMETSMTEKGSLLEPEFLVKFSSFEKVN